MACPPFVADAFARGDIMTLRFCFNKATSMLDELNRLTCGWLSAAHTGRSGAACPDGAPAGSGMFCLLVPGDTLRDRWL
jgi:hypothetical protein